MNNKSIADMIKELKQMAMAAKNGEIPMELFEQYQAEVEEEIQRRKANMSKKVSPWINVVGKIAVGGPLVYGAMAAGGAIFAGAGVAVAKTAGVINILHTAAEVMAPELTHPRTHKRIKELEERIAYLEKMNNLG